MWGKLIPKHVVTAMARRKPLAFAIDGTSSSSVGGDQKEVGLRRTLELHDLILYGVGCSVGAGIYCLVGIGAEIAGPAIALSFLLCGTACVFTSLSYAEFAARIPVTGSAYVYAYVAFGEFMAWLVGWSLTLNYAFSASVVARSWAEYLASFLRGLSLFGTDANGADLMWLTRLHLPLPFIPISYSCSPLSIVIIALCTLVLVTGAKESSRFNNAMTILNLSCIAFVIFAGLGTRTVEAENLNPFFPEGIGGVLQGSGLVFFAFIGFDMVACLSEEVKNPEVNMPLGIVGTLAATTTIYVSVALVVIGMAPFHLLGGDVPIVNALLANGCCTHKEQIADFAGKECLTPSCYPVVWPLLLYGSRLISFGAIFGLTTGTFTSLMGQPRIFYRMAKDGLLFKIFAKVNPRTQIPTEGTVLTGILCSILSCFVNLEVLANLISLGTLAVFTFVDVGVIILRMRPVDFRPSISLCSLQAFEDDDCEDEDQFPSSDVRSAPVEEEPQESLWEKVFFVYQGFTFGAVGDNGMKPTYFSILFTISTIVASMAYSNGWGSPLLLCCSAAAAFSAAILMSLPRSSPPDTFQCPFVPAVPILGIGCNGYMMGSLPLSSWAFLFLWLALGVGIYFLYGVKHSTLRNTTFDDTTDESTASEYTPLRPSGKSSQSASYDMSLNVSLHEIHRHET